MSQVLDLRLLRYFVAVAEEEHVSRAAERLHVSQSPLSRQIRELEARLGVELFEREKKRLYLTAAGRRFLDEARSLLAQAEAAEARIKDWARGGALNIGFVEGAMLGQVLDAAIKRFHADFPAVSLHLSAMSSAGQHRALLERRLDLGFVHTLPADPAALRVLPLEPDALVLAIPAAHPLARVAEIQAQDLREVAWIVSPGRERFVSALNAQGIEPDIRFEAGELMTRLRMVGAGLGFAFLQASIRDCVSMPDVVFRDVPWLPIEVPFFALCRRNQADPLVNAFLSASGQEQAQAGAGSA